MRPQFAMCLVFVLSNYFKQTVVVRCFGRELKAIAQLKRTLTVWAAVTDEALASMRAAVWVWALA